MRGKALLQLREIAAPLSKRILVAGLVGGAVAVLITFLLPPKYESTATLLLESQRSVPGVLEAGPFSEMLQSGGLDLGSSRENGFAYLQICKSRSALLRVLSRPDKARSGAIYMDRFSPTGGSQAERIDVAVKRLNKSVATTFDVKSSVFRVGVRTRDAALSANVANQLVDELQVFNSQMRATRSSASAAFVAARVGEARSALARSEAALLGFQQSNARIGTSPNLHLQLKRLEREVRLDEETFALLSRQLELARIQEKKDSPLFSVIDPATPPIKPDRLPLVLVGLLGACLSGTASFLVGVASAGRRRPRLNRAA